MFDEDELLPLSALQHLTFCERRCALIHIEGEWADNTFTLEGAHLHARVDELQPTESRGDTRIARGLRLRSLRLGLWGKADVVEFHRIEISDMTRAGRTAVDEIIGGSQPRWRPFPIEYKRGRPQDNRCYEVQLCAQALCLEEMLGHSVSEGALFFATPKRRFEVRFDDELRATTEEAAKRLHALIRAGVTPQAVREPKCRRCSLEEVCMPDAMAPRQSVREYLARAVRALDD